ncbi:MAG: lipid-A-disaccharide synthase, partial [Longimicrobiales bacterium]
RVVPELIQDQASPEALAESLIPLLRDGAERERVQSGLARVRAKLAGGPDGRTAAERVAAMAAELLESSAGRAC